MKKYVLLIVVVCVLYGKDAFAGCALTSYAATGGCVSNWIDVSVTVNEVHTYSDGSVWFVINEIPGQYFKLDSSAPATDAGLKNILASILTAQSTSSSIRFKTTIKDPANANTHLVSAFLIKK